MVSGDKFISRGHTQFLRRVATAVIALLAFTSVLAAQSTSATGSIGGAVTDPQGKAVARAHVTIRNSDFSTERTAITNDHGDFAVALLPAGIYTVRVKAAGLSLPRPLRVTVNVGSSVHLNLRLQLARSRQVVTVTGRRPTLEGNTVPPAVNKQAVSAGNFLAGLTVTYLPNRDRQFGQFAELAAGVEPDARGTGIIVDGQVPSATQVSVDGFSFNDPLEGGPRGARDGALFFPQTVVREFEIVHAGVGSDVGGTTAGFVNIATKSGSDKIHGEALYMVRPPALTSSDTFARPLDDLQDVFGGSLGGPIKRDHAFFYVGVEQDLLHSPYWTEFEPQAAGTSVPASLASLQQQIVEHNDPTALFGRTDFVRGPRTTLTLEMDYNRVRAADFNGEDSTRVMAPESFSESLGGQSMWPRASLITVISPRAVNQLLGQWTADRRDFTPNQTSPEIFINGFGALGGNSLSPLRYTSHTRQVGDDFTMIRGAAILHVGGSFADDPADDQRETNLNGRFDFNSLADYLADQPRRYQQTFVTGDAVYAGSVRELALYGDSRVPLATGLTLTAGLRWTGQWNPQPPHPNLAVPQTTRIPNDLTQWQPRVGLVWNPAPNTVIRVSSGLYDAPTPAATFQRVFADNGLETVVADSYYDPEIVPLVAALGAPLHSLASPPASLTTPAALVAGIDPNFRNPRAFQFSASVEQQLGPKFTLSAGYLRERAWDLPVQVNLNLERPVIEVTGMPVFPLTRPNSAIGQLLVTQSAVSSTYDGLLLTAAYKLSRRSQLMANYTLSSTGDDGADSGPFGIGAALNPFNLRLDEAHSLQDMRHNFNLSGLYYLPLGFKVDPILIAHSGTPYTPIIGFDTQNDGNDLNDRAILNGVVAGRDSVRQPGFFDTDIRFVKDFTLPGKGHHLDVFMDVFNITASGNRNFGPEAISYFGTQASPVFTAGQPLFAPDSTSFGGARQIQFTVRLVAF
jgi:Carboxypeptidase regulatory-like domain/TonB dependent receptor-like, beta-barrel